LAGLATPAISQTPTIRFGVEAWPGLAVKTQVVTDIINALGYKTKQKHMDTPFIVRGLMNNSVDVALGMWFPLLGNLVPPLVKKGKIIKLSANLNNALAGLVVPQYVHEAGVSTLADLHRYGKRFDYKIHVIEAGSTYTQSVQQAIQDNFENIGDFKAVPSSSAAMLAEVAHKINKKQWIVFYGWKPHWMNITYNLYYLKLPPGTKARKHPIVDTKATVYTIVAKDFPEKRPNLTRFLKQFQVNDKNQSQWILEYSKEKKSQEEIVQNWIRTHPKIIKGYLKDVSTIDGKPAFPAVKAAFDMHAQSSASH
jgi:glycine betaine/proline transport system substrate-binding protein